MRYFFYNQINQLLHFIKKFRPIRFQILLRNLVKKKTNYRKLLELKNTEYEQLNKKTIIFGYKKNYKAKRLKNKIFENYN